MNLNLFLAKTVEGYLFGDLAKMKSIKLAPNEEFGGCGYPMLITTLSGIELLGLLMNKKTIEDEEMLKSRGLSNFLSYWKYLKKVNSKYTKGLGIFIRMTVRNPIAHNFVTYPNIEVRKFEDPEVHLTIDPLSNVLRIDPHSMYEDLKTSYINKFLLSLDRKTAQDRLNDLEKIYRNTPDFNKYLRSVKAGNTTSTSTSTSTTLGTASFEVPKTTSFG